MLEPLTTTVDAPDPGLQERLDAYWTWRADAYDAGQRRAERLAEDEAVWTRVWAGALPAAPADVLDVGTGSGRVALLLAGLGHRVTGTDLSAGMLARARAHAALLPAGRAPRFLRDDAVAPGFAPGGFDAVVNRYVVWTLRDPAAALAAWRRLLRPGGVLALVDAPWFPRGLHDGDGAGEEFRTAYDERARRALPLAEAPSIAATVEAVRAAGFADVAAEPLHEVLALDLRHGAAPGHEPRLQHLVTARAR
ncbi:class I SAM-dependent methyltransferase [Kineococcus sp. SYSU DK004]|uniref:class I SAM-dependent methyltransferase n=1 Tax=Kineococcus sp. SYSU DK004 TaxID=3383125 RepID=UPI003D7C86C5